ncbi:MAG: D-2-hydroxyacid dehydrogenase [Dehalococcoidia bacterium]|nr:D-2-hydroxyacid dehydrogenase [Dehalococcoidia bacterium]
MSEGLLVSPGFLLRHGDRLRAVLAEMESPPDLVELPHDPAERLSPDVLERITLAHFSADVFPDYGRSYFSAALKAPNLRWMHIFNAGTDDPVFGTLMEKGVRITNSAGSTAEPIANTAIGGMLMLARPFLAWMESQRRNSWEPIRDAERTPPDLRGQTMVVLGLGNIGREIARLARAFGMHVIGMRRSPRRDDDPVDEMLHPSELHTALGRAQWLAIAAPLTAETRGVIDEAALRAMPRGGRVMNVGRGEIIDEPALIAALRDGHLGGAYLDVASEEPLPPDSPLWELPNVIITPHNSAVSSGNEERTTQMFLDNLARWGRGEPLHNEVRD